ncbi:DNA methyltransferase [Oryzomicrobium sp.]|uniref:DNA methyltransferase n=1 Tax=Oryzomicrobium sp. TaxID=1911578 RepID=UPI002FE34747
MLNAIKAIDQVVTGDYAIYHGDACELIRAVPDNSIPYGIHSPPFEGLYRFTNSPRDISNNDGAAFWEHYQFLIGELLRVTAPGRLHSVHVMQLPALKQREGFIGIRDFRGDVVRAYQAAGWIFHSEVCIWKDPVVQQQRTKSLRLLHKQLCKDSSMSGQGLADYVVTFRKPGDNETAIAGGLEHYAGDALDVSPAAWEKQADAMRAAGREPWPYRTWVSIMVWQRYASPVWTDISQSRTLQYRSARDEKDEQHISPLQLDVIERCIQLWSLPGEAVLTPFMGIGSEVWVALEQQRRAVGFELKSSYWHQAVRNTQQLDDRLMAALLGVAA